MKDFELRIRKVLGDDNERCASNAERWRAHLLKVLPLPIRVTGIDDFSWEEPYIFGGWDKREYAELKKTRPSYTDVFDLLDIEGPEEHDDLAAKVRRTTDRRLFDIGLSWLRTESKEDPLYHVLNDYSVWHCNY